ncbi:MAG: hypothetical protein LH477_00360 [Nocardioides sp.]|nr:hypothetical protein [Nocardioides sp.]
MGPDRYYLLSAPDGVANDAPLPVVVDFHGLLEGAQIHSQMSQFGPYAAEEGFLAVFPHGRGEPVKWQVDLDRAGNPDLVYVDALLDQLEAERCVERDGGDATRHPYRPRK